MVVGLVSNPSVVDVPFLRPERTIDVDPLEVEKEVVNKWHTGYESSSLGSSDEAIVARNDLPQGQVPNRHDLPEKLSYFVVT